MPDGHGEHGGHGGGSSGGGHGHEGGGFISELIDGVLEGAGETLSEFTSKKAADTITKTGTDFGVIGAAAKGGGGHGGIFVLLSTLFLALGNFTRHL